MDPQNFIDFSQINRWKISSKTFARYIVARINDGWTALQVAATLKELIQTARNTQFGKITTLIKSTIMTVLKSVFL